MTGYKYIMCFLLVGISGLLSAQTLEDYLKEAAQANPGLKAKYYDFEASMERVAQVNALPDPTLSFGYFISPAETRLGPQRATFSLSQMFPWFGTLSSAGEAANLMAESKYQVFLDARNELFYKVKAAWYPLSEVNRKLDLQKANNEILLTYKELAVSAFKNGKGSMVDAIRVDIMIENSETEIKLLEDKMKPLLAHFNKLLNRDEGMEVSIAATSPVEAVEPGYRKDSLLIINPMLAAFDLRKQSVAAQTELARKQGLPKLGVGLDYVIVGERTDMDPVDNGQDIIIPKVSLSLPIFRNKYKAAVREAQFTQTAIAASKENFENELVSSYELTFYEIERTRQLINLYEEQTENTELTINLLLSAYTNSGKEFEEVLRMQQELLKYQIADATAVKEYYTALAKLDYLTAKTEQ